MIASALHGKKRTWIAAIFLILFTSALSYLILAWKFGFYGDDWYLVYAGYAEGSWKYGDIFSIDRPFRAYFVARVFNLFGLSAPLYSYLSYLLRVSGAVGFYWLITLLWPRYPKVNVLLAVLFGIYPGWMDQPAAFDYQSHLLSFSLLIWSYGLMIFSLRVRNWLLRAGLIVMAVGFQVAAFLQMEYYIGMEGLRLGLLAYLILGGGSLQFFRSDWPARFGKTALHWLPYLAGAAGFMYWRTFIFSSSRAATDINTMFVGLAESPLHSGLKMLLSVIHDFFDIILLAWIVPLAQKLSKQSMLSTIEALGVALLVVAVVAGVYTWLWGRREPAENSPSKQASQQDGLAMLSLGILAVITSILPVALGNRQVIFPTFSRFSLPGSVGAVMILGGLLIGWSSALLRRAVPLVLIGLAVMMHHSNAIQFAEDWAVMRNFWWQMVWRAPDIAEDTVMTVEYPGVGIAEDYFIWGPANLVYYPESHRRDNHQFTPIGAILITPDVISDLQTGRERGNKYRRMILSPQKLDHLLVVDQPARDACISVLDGKALELSPRTRERIAEVASYSKVEAILPGAKAHTPPGTLFGVELEHDWCYYYQKASLARQRGDWEEVVRLGDEALPSNPRPAELVELMPFVQGYAYLDRFEQVDQIAALYADQPFLRQQACDRFSEDVYGYGKVNPKGQAYLVQMFCD